MKEFLWGKLQASRYKINFTKAFVEIYMSAPIFGCYRKLGLGQLRLESFDSREIKTSRIFK